MMQNIFQNYVFQSQVSPKVGIKPIHEDGLTRLDTATSTHTIGLKTTFCGVDISYAVINTSGYVTLYTPGGTAAVIVNPWKYSSPQFYSDENIENQIISGKRMRKCGVWTGNTQSGVYIKWRFLSSDINIIQYEFDCTVYNNGIIELGYAPFDGITTTKNYYSFNESGVANCYIKGYNQGSSGVQVGIDVSDTSLLVQNSDLGGERQVGGIFLFNNVKNTNWPGKRNFGAVYRFVPPPSITKKILPRLELRNQDTQSTFFENGLFDDRKSLSFGTEISNLPTQLPRLFGQLSTFDNPDVSVYTDLQLSGQLNPDAINPWIPKDPSTVSSFSESQLFEQDIKNTQFYQTGSSISDVGLGFNGNLGQKTVFKYEMPILSPHKLAPTSATLSYYDNWTKSFRKVGYDQDPQTSLAVFGDARLYTAFGTPVASGNSGISTITNSQVNSNVSPFLLPHPWVQADMTRKVVSDAYQYALVENITSNVSFSFDYNSIEPMIFQNEKSLPFLVEKVIVEMPFSAGPGWFNDRTIARKTNRYTEQPDRCVPDAGTTSPSWSYNISVQKYTLTSDTTDVFYFTLISGTTYQMTGASTGTFTFVASGGGNAGIFTEIGGVNRIFTLTYVAGGGLAPDTYTWVSECGNECSPGGTVPETCVTSSGIFRKNSSTGVNIFSLYSGGILTLILTQSGVGSFSYSSSDGSTFTFDGSTVFTEDGAPNRTITLSSSGVAGTYDVTCPEEYDVISPEECSPSSGTYVFATPNYLLTSDDPTPLNFTLAPSGGSYEMTGASTGTFTYDVGSQTFTEVGGEGRTIVLSLNDAGSPIYTLTCPEGGMGFGRKVTSRLKDFIKSLTNQIMMHAPAGSDTGDAIDVGGPCVTVGIIKENRNKYLDGFSFPNQGHYDFSHREVILSGTIIPSGDNIKKFDIIRLNPISEDSQLILSGFNAYSGNPSAIINPDVNGKFTGSVRLNLLPQSVNVLYYSYGNNKSVTNYPTSSNPTSAYGYNKKWLDLYSDSEFSMFQNLKGYNISGLNRVHDNRSVFGRTYDTYQSPLVNGIESLFVKNPWYDFQPNMSSSVNTWINTFPSDSIHVQYVGMLPQFNTNPYLLLPGDRLSFFVSKYRPVKTNFFSDSYSELANECWEYSSQHDVQIPTGSLKVSVYGSYISEGKERHDPTQDSLKVDNIHEILGNDPIDDQWELWDDRELIGTFFDDVSVTWQSSSYTNNLKPTTTLYQNKRVTGLSYGVNHFTQDISENGPIQLLLSKNDPYNGYLPRNYLFGYNTYSSLLASDYFVKNFELMGSNRISPKQKHLCESEVIYDSITPGIQDTLKLDGVIPSETGFFPNVGLYVLSPYNVGFSGSALSCADYFSTYRSFPFESRYVALQRKLNESSYLANSGSINVLGIEIPENVNKSVKNIAFEIVQTYEANTGSIGRRTIFYDYKYDSLPTFPNGTLVPPQRKDLLKFFFGFGDNLSSSVGTIGANVVTSSYVSLPTFRWKDTSVLNSSNLDFVTSPLIRGWKYGLYSGLISNTNCVFRRSRYGQYRDMLEQRQFTVFNDPKSASPQTGPVLVRFLTQSNSGLFETINPSTFENNLSLNLSPFVTSSLPFFDGETRD